MNRFNGFEGRNGEFQFDDNSCKRYQPREPGCGGQENCFAPEPVSRGLWDRRDRWDQEVRRDRRVFPEPEAR